MRVHPAEKPTSYRASKSVNDTFFLARQAFTLRYFEIQPVYVPFSASSALTDYDVLSLHDELRKFQDAVKAFGRDFKGKGLPVHHPRLVFGPCLPPLPFRRFYQFFCAAVGDRVRTSRLPFSQISGTDPSTITAIGSGLAFTVQWDNGHISPKCSLLRTPGLCAGICLNVWFP